MISFRSTPFRSLAAVLAAMGIAAIAFAQPDGGPSARPAMPQTQQLFPLSPAPAPLIDVNFPGGAVSAYCEAVRAAASPNVVNIIINQGAGDVTLPPISLKQVTVEVAMRVLTMTGQSSVGSQVSMQRLDDQGASTYVLQSGELNGFVSPRSSPETSVYSLRSIVEPPPGIPNTDDVALPIDTVMAALSAALSADDRGPGPKPDLKLHRESLMLIVRGNMFQQNVVQSTLNLMSSDMKYRRDKLSNRIEAAEKARLDRVTSEAEVKQAQASVAKATADHEEALHNLDLIQKRIDSGLSPQTDLSRAQSDVTSAKANLDEAKAQYEMAKSRAAVLAERQAAMMPPTPPASSRIVVIYNAEDFAAFKDDIMAVASALLGDQGKVQWTNNSLVATGTNDAQQALGRFLLTLRRVKANDPLLAPAADMAKPGLDDDDAPK